jgi:mitochondrial import receptor subunit TOM20
MKTKTVAIATLGTVAALALGYVIYFDQKRRNDPEFRRKLSTFGPKYTRVVL